ncbi:MAG: cytochrome c [Acidobacteria bacterium]|nr:cytochrome c [Acidobacteriota bacterium]
MIRNPLFQAFLLMVGAYIFYTYGIAVLSKPIPSSLVTQYMGITLGVVFLYMASSNDVWSEFKRPIYETLLGLTPTHRTVRLVALIAIPLFVGYRTYMGVKPSTQAPPPFRTVHPANPESISFNGKTISMITQANPLRADAAQYESHVAVGKRVYYQHCFYCHGDTWAGDGHFARGFVPKPAKFTGDETLAILTESYVFWRIAKGGPGLPREATPWNSAMPAWEGRLSEDEIWSVIMYLYDAIGKEPRSQSSVGEGH